jgi:nucleotide-binding universal stress UspA family protein
MEVPMKVLVPIDIVQPLKPLLDELQKLVALKSAEVTFVYVKEHLPAYEHVIGTTGDFADDWTHKIDEKAKVTLDEAKQAIQGKCAAVEVEIATGPPAMMIDEIANEDHFDITVVTPHKHTLPGKLFLGSVSSKVLKHVRNTILIARPKDSGNAKLRKVVMGIDGSEQSKYAIRESVKRFAIEPDTEITLLHAVSVADVMKLVSPVEYITMVENNLLLEGETYIAEGKNILSEAGFTNVNTVLKEGDPTHEILALAESMPADLIVIGAQGRTAVQHFLLGSVSHKIATGSKCSTAVVKSPATK